MLGEKSRAAVGVHQRSAGGDELGHQIEHRLGDGVVGLLEEPFFAGFGEGVVAVGHPAGAKPREPLVDFARGNGATLDIHQRITVGGVKSDDSFGHVNADAVAVAVRLWRRDDGAHGHLGELADAPQSLLHLTRLDGELGRVGDMLVGASAATAEIGTLGLDTIRRRLGDRNERGFGIVFLFAGDRNGDGFARNGVGNEDDQFFAPAHAFSSKGDVVNG